jgi:hypothetical protein
VGIFLCGKKPKSFGLTKWLFCARIRCLLPKICGKFCTLTKNLLAQIAYKYLCVVSAKGFIRKNEFIMLGKEQIKGNKR